MRMILTEAGSNGFLGSVDPKITILVLLVYIYVRGWVPGGS